MKKENKVRKFFVNVALSPVYFFKFCISPLLPHCCIFTPTCSQYMIEAVKEFGIFKGGWMGVKRVLRCNPFQKKRGYDPVKINIKGDNVWLL